MNKPPLGLIPEYIYKMQSNTERIAMIIEAMKRYSTADKPIPIKWVEELERRIFYEESEDNDGETL